MNAEQFGRLMAELQEIKVLLAGKAGEQEAAPVEVEPALVWFRSSYSDHWWAGPVKGDYGTAVYSTDGVQYYAGGEEDCVSLIGVGMLEGVPFAAAVGVILGHAATNGIRVEPFPWHLVGKKEQPAGQPVSEWVAWDGGACPVSRDQRVEVKFRGEWNGQKTNDELMAGDWGWWHDGADDDIVAYRIIGE